MNKTLKLLFNNNKNKFVSLSTERIFDTNNPNGIIKDRLLNIVISNFWDNNQNRLLRDMFDFDEYVGQYCNEYMIINKQKLSYLLDTALSDFITAEETTKATSNDSMTMEDIDYNTDYYGGEGQTGKGSGTNTSTGTTEGKNISVDNRYKNVNWFSLMSNTLFKTLENKLFETFYIDEEITW